MSLSLLSSPAVGGGLVKILAPRLPLVGSALIARYGRRQMHRLTLQSSLLSGRRFYAKSVDDKGPEPAKSEENETKRPVGEAANAGTSSQIVSHAILAKKEQEANKGLANPDAQAAFYRLLLQSNYPQYVVSRFETPGIASSPECSELYMEALQRIGRHSEADAVRQTLLTASSAGAVNPSLASSGVNSPAYHERSPPCIHLLMGLVKNPCMSS